MLSSDHLWPWSAPLPSSRARRAFGGRGDLSFSDDNDRLLRRLAPRNDSVIKVVCISVILLDAKLSFLFIPPGVRRRPPTGGTRSSTAPPNRPRRSTGPPSFRRSCPRRCRAQGPWRGP